MVSRVFSTVITVSVRYQGVVSRVLASVIAVYVSACLCYRGIC